MSISLYGSSESHCVSTKWIWCCVRFRSFIMHAFSLNWNKKIRFCWLINVSMLFYNYFAFRFGTGMSKMAFADKNNAPIYVASMSYILCMTLVISDEIKSMQPTHREWKPRLFVTYEMTSEQWSKTHRKTRHHSHNNQNCFRQIDIVTLTSCIHMIIFKSNVISLFRRINNCLHFKLFLIMVKCAWHFFFFSFSSVCYRFLRIRFRLMVEQARYYRAPTVVDPHSTAQHCNCIQLIIQSVYYFSFSCA